MSMGPGRKSIAIDDYNFVQRALEENSIANHDNAHPCDSVLKREYADFET